MQGKLNSAQIEVLLQQQLMGRIGCHANGITYIFPISYAYDGECIYAHTQLGSKLSTMRANPLVCFEVEQIQSLADWQTVVLQGKFEELTSQEDRRIAVKKLMQRNFPVQSSSTMKFSKFWPFASPEDEQISGIFFRVVITDKQGRYEKPCLKQERCSGNCRVHKVMSLEEVLTK